MNNTASIDSNGQYSLAKILGIWLAGGAPLWIFGWLVHPALSQGLLAVDRGLLWMKLMIIGLVWQFVQYRKSHPVEVAARASHCSRSVSNWALTRRIDRVCRQNRC